VAGQYACASLPQPAGAAQALARAQRHVRADLRTTRPLPGGSCGRPAAADVGAAAAAAFQVWWPFKYRGTGQQYFKPRQGEAITQQGNHQSARTTHTSKRLRPRCVMEACNKVAKTSATWDLEKVADPVVSWALQCLSVHNRNHVIHPTNDIMTSMNTTIRFPAHTTATLSPSLAAAAAACTSCVTVRTGG
jgi:hypothetical protein